MYHIISRLLLRRGLLTGALMLAACTDTTSEPPTQQPPLRIAIVSGDNQVAPADSPLPAPLVVRVADHRDRPVPGVSIRWTLVEAGGYTGPAAPPISTDVRGQASFARRLGSVAGIYRTIARISGDSGETVRFTAVAHVQNATRMQPAVGFGLAVTDTVRAILPPHRVLLLDHLDRPVPGVVVTWTASSAGTLTAQTSTTDASGIAQITHTLGTKVGHYSVSAHVAGLPETPVTFPVVATPGKPVALTPVGGVSQAGRVGTSVGPYAVSLTDAHGNGHSGFTVSWSVIAGAGQVDRTTSAATLGHGIVGETRPAAIAVHTLGLEEEPQVVAATLRDLPGIAPVTFSTVPVTTVVSIGGLDDYYCYYYGWCTWAFMPSQNEVPVGKSVLWTWWGRDPHHIVFEDEPTPPSGPGPQITGTRVRRFTSTGTIRYRCTVHSTSFTEGMVGSVTVK